MLRISRRKLQDHSVVRASALHPPFSAAFDLVTCFSALGHFFPSEHAQLVAAVKSCLRPGGHFLFSRKCTLKMLSPKDSLSFATTVNLLERSPLMRAPATGMMTAHGPSTEPSGPLEARAEAVDHALDVAFVRPDLVPWNRSSCPSGSRAWQVGCEAAGLQWWPVRAAPSERAVGREDQRRRCGGQASATVEVVVARGPAGHGHQRGAPAYQ